MSFVVNVHYKSDPEDLFWSYSGRLHDCLQDAVEELMFAAKQPHIDKAVVAGGSRKDQPMTEEEILEKAITKSFDAFNDLITVNKNIAHIPAAVSIGAMVYGIVGGLIKFDNISKEEILLILKRVINDIEEDYE